ncbi:mycofactocin precursor MftA [Streptomyces humi]|nr:mycofactocin precursor MftA [Streptomyces humi]
MNELHVTPPVTASEPQDERHPAEQPLMEADELIEEVSIDGMCGVY